MGWSGRQWERRENGDRGRGGGRAGERKSLSDRFFCFDLILSPLLPTSGDISLNLFYLGVVVAVLSRKVTEMIATIPLHAEERAGGECMSSSSSSSSTREEFLLAVPIDRKLPKIRILTRQYQLLKGQRISVSFDSWPPDSKYPNGHFTRYSTSYSRRGKNSFSDSPLHGYLSWLSVLYFTTALFNFQFSNFSNF